MSIYAFVPQTRTWLQLKNCLECSRLYLWATQPPAAHHD